MVASRDEESAPALDAMRREARAAARCCAPRPLGEDAAAQRRPLARPGRRRRAVPRLPRGDRRQPVPAAASWRARWPATARIARRARRRAEPGARHARDRRAAGAAAGRGRAGWPRAAAVLGDGVAAAPGGGAGAGSTDEAAERGRRARRRRRPAQRAPARVPAPAAAAPPSTPASGPRCARARPRARRAAARRGGRVARARRRAAAALPAGRRSLGLRAAGRRPRAWRRRAAPPTRSPRTCGARSRSPPPPEGRDRDPARARRAPSAQFDPARAIAHLREALAAELELEPALPRRRCCWPACSATPGGRARRPTSLEEQLAAFEGTPRLRAAGGRATRTSPASTRPRGARADAVIERLRAPRRARRRARPAVLGTIAAEMGMAGEPVDRMAELAEHAVAGREPTATTRGRAGPGTTASARSSSAERYDVGAATRWTT